jgi:membrane-associated protease RseP (regulator of RpoE activity)
VKRALFVLLVPVAIYLLGSLIALIALVTWGAAQPTNQQMITGTLPNSPAERAGLHGGDEIVGIDDHGVDEAPVRTLIERSGDRPVRVRFIRDNLEKVVVVTPASGRIGVQLVPGEICKRPRPATTALWSIAAPAYSAWALVRRARRDPFGGLEIRSAMDLPCSRRNRYVANAAAGLGILSMLALPISVGVAVRRARKASPSSRSPR